MRFLLSAAAAILAAVLPLSAPAQDYPTRSVKIIVTLAPGGTADILARLLAEKLSSAWGQPVVVENRPGASGMIGAEAVAKADPDGYTLLMGYNAEIAINPSIFRSMSYDPRKAFTPVTKAVAVVVGRRRDREAVAHEHPQRGGDGGDREPARQRPEARFAQAGRERIHS